MPVRGRMLSASLSQSRKFARLDNNDHRLMYVMILPHVDCEGRHDAEPTILAGKCFTSLGFTTEQVQVALGDMSNVGLIHLYEIDGEMFLEIVDFLDYQIIRRKANGDPVREAPSKIPSRPTRRSTDAEVRQNRVRSASEVPADVRQERDSENPAETAEGSSGTECRSTDAEVTQKCVSTAHLSAAQSKPIQDKGLGALAPNPPSEPPRRSRPGGRARPAELEDYLRRQAERQKPPELVVPKVEA